MPDNLTPTPDPSKSEQKKSAAERRAQAEQAKARLADSSSLGANANPIVDDATYGDLREQNRVVMRHQIALNIDSFRAATDDFLGDVRQQAVRKYPPLRLAAAPFASIVIPNYNGARFLPTLLDALAKQAFQDFEILLVDDASSDESVAFVEEHYPNVRVIVNRRNLGFAASCNAGAEAASGRVLVLLNNDTEPEPEWLASLVRAVCEQPNAAVVTSKILLHDGSGRLHTTGDLLGANGLPRNRGVWEQDAGQYDMQLDVFSGCGGASAFRRDAWRALGGFDEEFWMYVEDVDYGFRARLAGWQVAYAPEARVHHHLSATGGGATASFYTGRNTIWLIAKNMPASLLRRHWAKIVGAQLGIAVDALRHWRGEAARARLRGQLAGLLGLSGQLRKRRVVQSRRAVTDGVVARWLSQ